MLITESKNKAPDNTISENTVFDRAALGFITKAVEKIQQQLNTGEITQACCMSAVSTPVTESWELAQELSVKYSLTPSQQQSLFEVLKPEVQRQLLATRFDDFDLIYECLLQRVMTG